MPVDPNFEFDDDSVERLPDLVQRKRQHRSEMGKITALLFGILVVVVLIGGLLYYQHIRAENRERYMVLMRQISNAASDVGDLENRANPEDLKSRLRRYEEGRFTALPADERRRIEDEVVRDEAEAAHARKVLPIARQKLRTLKDEAESIWPR